MLDWMAVWLVLSQCLLDSYGVWETFCQQKQQIGDIQKAHKKRRSIILLQPYFWLRVLFHAFVLKPLLFVSLSYLQNSITNADADADANANANKRDNLFFQGDHNNERAEGLVSSFVPFTFLVSFICWTVWQICVLVFCDELFFYFWHRLLHESRYLYRHVHSLHHVSVDSIYPMHYLYVHPLEMVVGSLGWTVAMLLLGGSLSLGVISCYGFAKVFQELKAHSLQSLQIEILLGLLGKSKMASCSPRCEKRARVNVHHLIHHHQKMGNYSSSFVFLDMLFHTQLSATSFSISN